MGGLLGWFEGDVKLSALPGMKSGRNFPVDVRGPGF